MVNLKSKYNLKWGVIQIIKLNWFVEYDTKIKTEGKIA